LKHEIRIIALITSTYNILFIINSNDIFGITGGNQEQSNKGIHPIHQPEGNPSTITPSIGTYARIMHIKESMNPIVLIDLSFAIRIFIDLSMIPNVIGQGRRFLATYPGPIGWTDSCSYHSPEIHLA
jgi:hypothetical protein